MQITSLLQRSLTSKEPLTGLYFENPIHYDDADLSALSDKLDTDQENNGALNNLKIRVLQTYNSSLLYAEVPDDFVDLLFGLLSIPIGSIAKAYGQCLGSVYNLYESLDGSAKECLRSEFQGLLLSPKSAPFSGSRATKVLQIEDSAPGKLSINACFTCFKIGGFSGLGRCWQRL